MGKNNKHICLNCNTEFVITKKDLYTCPYCGNYIVDEDSFSKIKEKIESYEYSDEDKERILRSKDELNKLADNYMLAKVRDYIEALYNLVKDKNSKKAHKVIAIAALIYVISPIDIIPDFIPIIGFLDDAIAVLIAASIIGVALNEYVNEKTNVKNKDKFIMIFEATNQCDTLTEAIVDGDVIRWVIPRNRINELNYKTIDDKLMGINELYVRVNSYQNTIAPLHNTDESINDRVFDETLNVLRLLGVKDIKVTKKIAIAEKAKVALSTEFKKVFESDIEIKSDKILIKTDNLSFRYDKTDYEKIIEDDKSIEKMYWIFTNQTILDKDIFNNRFKKSLREFSAKKKIEFTELLSVQSKNKIKKVVKLDSSVNLEKTMAVHWELDIEFYPLNDSEQSKIDSIYDELKYRLEKREKELIG